MAKVKLDLQKKSDAELVPFAKGHVAKMVENAATFATPDPSVADFAAGLTAYEDALTLVKTTEKAAQEAIAAKDLARDVLEGLLNGRGAYVDKIADGDEPTILSGGFAVRAISAPIGEILAPANLRASFGDDAGEIDLIWDRVRGARSYIIEYREDGATAWTMAPSQTKSRTTVAGLTTGKVYEFRVRGVGAAGEGPWSDPASKLAP